MFMEYYLYFLTFLFGYFTCRTFYFFRANRISISLIKLSHVIYLSSVVKCIENLVYTRDTMKLHYNQIDVDNDKINELERKMQDRIEHLKNNSVKYLIDWHPSFYREALVFDDWESSMQYLLKNKQLVYDFWRKHDKKD